MKREHIEGLEFTASKQALSLGVELELQVLDEFSLLLTPHAQDILDKSNEEKLDHEFFQSTLEIRSAVCNNVFALEKDIQGSLDTVFAAARALNLRLGSTGTHPLADYRETLVTPSPRYDQLIDRNQWIIRRMAVYGMHVHIGMPSGDACIQYSYFFMHLLPQILTLSASSPFWQGKYTGLSACRPTTYESLPTAGMPYMVKDWDGFQKLYQFLLRSKSIGSMKDLWWDIRPSPKYGTMELRFCDEPATLYEVKAIASFIHLLAHWFHEHGDEWSSSHAPLKQWIFRENKWRTLRFGLDADIVITRTGKTKSLRNDIFDWLKKLEPYAKELHYGDQLAVVREIAQRGNSAQRQYQVFTETNDLEAVVKHCVAEFESGRPHWISG